MSLYERCSLLAGDKCSTIESANEIIAGLEAKLAAAEAENKRLREGLVEITPYAGHKTLPYIIAKKALQEGGKD